MTDTELKKLIEDCCDDIFNRLEPLANVKSRLYESLKPAINYTRCCDKLKDKEKLTFDEWCNIFGYTKSNDKFTKRGINYSESNLLSLYKTEYLENL